jgi:DNA-binding response OmpR family regulator
VGSILLVEIEPDTRDALVIALREVGHEALHAATLREGFLRISEGGIDAVVIDSADPRIGVVELARNMNALPDAPPLVLVSGSLHAPEISARIGAAAFLTKPCDPRELVIAIQRLAGEVRPVQQFDDDEPTGQARTFG